MEKRGGHRVAERPPIRITVSLTPEEHAAASERAEAQGDTISQVVRNALRRDNLLFEHSKRKGTFLLKDESGKVREVFWADLYPLQPIPPEESESRPS